LPRAPCRKFNLGDGMILIAATAVGFAIVRQMVGTTPQSIGMYHWHWVASLYGMPVVMAWSIGQFLIRLRQPRPRFRRLFRQPGTAAAVVAISMTTAWCLPFPIARLLGYGSPSDPGILLYSAITAGPGVLGAWSVLALSRTMRAERGWIDRAGIALGVGWIVLFVLALADINGH